MTPDSAIAVRSRYPETKEALFAGWTWPPTLEQLSLLPRGHWLVRHYVRILSRDLGKLLDEGRRRIRRNDASAFDEIQSRYQFIRGEQGYPQRLDDYLKVEMARRLSVQSSVREIVGFAQDLDDESIRRYKRFYPVDAIAYKYAMFPWESLQLPPEGFNGVYEPEPRPEATPAPWNFSETVDLLLTINARFAGLRWTELLLPDPGYRGFYIPLPRRRSKSTRFAIPNFPAIHQ